MHARRLNALRERGDRRSGMGAVPRTGRSTENGELIACGCRGAGNQEEACAEGIVHRQRKTGNVARSGNACAGCGQRSAGCYARGVHVGCAGRRGADRHHVASSSPTSHCGNSSFSRFGAASCHQRMRIVSPAHRASRADIDVCDLVDQLPLQPFHLRLPWFHPPARSEHRVTHGQHSSRHARWRGAQETQSRGA